ncbi:MAG: SRPBCC family protein [Cryobacterium sp.]|nr:SRPBCC family protein [Cryobacterium sp.]
MIFESRHISQVIGRDPGAVAAYAGNPANLPRWAEGLSSGIRLENGRWLADSPMGAVEVRFLGGLEFGILDHDVLMPDGTIFHNPMRVVRNGDASEIIFTLYRWAGTSDDDYEKDAAMIRSDLARLRAILEAQG